MSIQCPGCGTAVEPAATSCPTCLRPRSRQEIFSGYGRAHSAEAARKGKPLKILRNLLILGGLAAGGYYVVREEWKSSGHLQEAASSLIHKTGRYRQGTASINPQSAPPQPPMPAPEPAPNPPPPAESTPAPMPATEVKPAEKTPPPERPPRWIISGRVFWYLDLKPATGATLVFKDKISGETLRILSGRDGGYKAALPPLEEGGYEVNVYVKSKQRSFVEDTVGPSVRQYSTERRKDEAAEHLRQGGVLHVPLLLPAGEMTLQYDMALLP